MSPLPLHHPRNGSTMSTWGERLPGPRPDWATVSRWIDAGKPPLNPDGTWDTPAPAATHKGGTPDD